MKNNRGSISILAILFITIITSLILWGYRQMIDTERSIKRKMNHYLCMKELIINHVNLVKTVELQNIQIAIGNSLQLNPKTYTAGKIMINSAKFVQKGSYFKSLAAITTSKYCPSYKKPLLIKGLPYRKSFNRVLNIAKLKEKKWKIQLTSLDLKNPYITIAKLKALGNGISNLKVTVEEYSKRDLPLSSSFFGAEL